MKSFKNAISFIQKQDIKPIVILLFISIISYQLLLPYNYFVFDDWALFAHGSTLNSRQVFQSSLLEPARPFYWLVDLTLSSMAGRNIWIYRSVWFISWLILPLLVYIFFREYMNSRYYATIISVIYLLLPNKHEIHHWFTILPANIHLALLLVTLTLIIRGMNQNKQNLLLVSPVLYILMLALYEMALGLPLLIIIYYYIWKPPINKKFVFRYAFIMLFCFIFYMIWRMSNAFGMGYEIVERISRINIYPTMIISNLINGLEYISPSGLLCFANTGMLGWNFIFRFGIALFILHLASALISVFLLMKYLHEKNETSNENIDYKRHLLFAFASMFILVPTLYFWGGSAIRHWGYGDIGLSVIAFCILFIILNAAGRYRKIVSKLMILLLLFLIFINQGQSMNWAFVSYWQELIYRHLETRKEDLSEDKYIVLISYSPYLRRYFNKNFLQSYPNFIRGVGFYETWIIEGMSVFITGKKPKYFKCKDEYSEMIFRDDCIEYIDINNCIKKISIEEVVLVDVVELLAPHAREWKILLPEKKTKRIVPWFSEVR
ncbi:MAG: hypothetical protein JXA60_02650 [Candidatus Coatesbacteria bacterium]|nr:hypothetical protein [Candidatus Coatesbacteria bacterium]